MNKGDKVISTRSRSTRLMKQPALGRVGCTVGGLHSHPNAHQVRLDQPYLYHTSIYELNCSVGTSNILSQIARHFWCLNTAYAPDHTLLCWLDVGIVVVDRMADFFPSPFVPC